MHKFFWLAIAGILGTLARYGLQGSLQHWSGARFPWGTFGVNAIGCLAFGIVWGLWEERLLNVEHRTIILVGFMGAFTTFSSFAFETAALLENRQWLLAAANLIGQNVVGVLLVFVGLAIGRWI